MNEDRRGAHEGAAVELPERLAGLEVAITGRLLSMTRAEAVAALAAVGARYVEAPGERTALLVYGAAGPTLGPDGRPTRALRAARELARAGQAIRIVPEERWLELVGQGERRAELHRLYTLAQLARILELEPARLRAWVRHGLVKPVEVVHRLAFFDYQEVVAARALAELSTRGVGPRALAASLALLRRWLVDDERPLARLAASLEGALFVRLDDGSWAEPCGQLVLDFEPEDERALADELARAPVDARARESARAPGARAATPEAELGWFERGVRAEERGQPGEALRCYLAAEHDGDRRPEVPFNRGNALWALERPAEAAAAFRAALELDAGYLEAWNNLGNALSAIGRHADAAAAFRRALSLAPGYADAHYNLAETLSELGELDDARRHWRAYLGLDPKSPSAEEVKRRLDASATGLRSE